jgi:ribosomal protein L11 methyltransferase
MEVSLTVDGELAEAVADVLARFAPGGVVVERGIGFRNADDPGTPLPHVRVCAYLPADDGLEETRQRLEESLWHLGQIQPLPAPRYTAVTEKNWMEAWKTHYHPLPVGESLIILPAWAENPDPARIPIRIDPGMAFGTGAHPTTQLILELLERHLPPGAEVIDVGCGSGILSIAARKLGAARVLGVDVDEASIESSRENAALNGIETESLVLARGSVREILEGEVPFRRAPLVMANILAPILIRLLENGLASLLAEGGVLLLSGILEEQETRLLDAARRNSLRILERHQQGDWVAFALHLKGKENAP